MRRLAQEVLLQRSDAEIFLISSIKHVREEMGKHGGQQPSPPHESRKQVDISQLSWSDRERILRLVFAKINNQSRQAQFMSLPSHSLTVDSLDLPLPKPCRPDPLQGLKSDAGLAQIV